MDGKAEGVIPVLDGRMSMTPEQALAILGHPSVKLIPADMVDEARAVQQRGEHWVKT